MIDNARRLDRGLALSDLHVRWIEQRAAEHVPPLSVTAMLGQLLDTAMVRHDERTRRRAWQLEVYEASGYPEHHPDYPGSRGSHDV
jgi:hypothetical protein